ncbi:hypothetical protein SAMN05421835_10267 [Amycolatopsis sacchari]|uniref:Uncharacterized protein n=2 Tax=Amycolatopsis sacchari TaxID=115433 RepID=A0A1I3LWR9_9PSEU|nr:hypothetical protein SAMN05421835_10267 [Amycolatopsis sacchari]
MNNQEELALDQLDVRVWNYDKKADTYITSPELRKTLDAIMQTNVHSRWPIKDMGIISIGEPDFREYSPEEKQLCQEVRTILFISALARSGVLERGPNVGHYIATSENFSLFEQNFQPDTKYTATQDGYVVNMWHGGHDITQVQFRAPEYVPKPIVFQQDTNLLAALFTLRKKQKRLYRRIMRATDMMMQAYYNDTKLSEAARILAIASAYEILFDLPESGQRRALRDEFERLFDLPSDPRRTFVTHKDRRGKTHRANKTVKVYWANKFYELRNAIIHGSPVKSDDYVFQGAQRYFDIAVLFLYWV